MRIGVDARELAGHATGVGRYLSELLARWTRDRGAASDELLLFLPNTPTHDLHWLGRDGARAVTHVAEGGGGTRWEQLTLAAAARQANLDVFFAPGYTAPLTLRTPVVVAMHDVSFAAHPEWFRRREGFRQRLLARRTARTAAAVVTLTPFSRDEIVRCLGVPSSRIEVIAPAVDAHPALQPTLAPPAEARDARRAATVLFVGSIFTRRHVPTLIDAFDDVARTHPDVRLVIVGADRTWPDQAIARRVAAARAAGRIDWHAWLDEAALRRAYLDARVFAFLSEYEGFGLTPLEALSAGIPPLVADVRGAHDAYGEAALYIDPHDAGAAAQGLRDLLDETPARRRILDAAPAVLGRYSWDTCAAQTYAVLRRAATTR